MKSLKPNIQEELKTEENCGTKYFVITPDTGLLFPSVDFVRTRLNKLALKYKTIKYFFLNFEKWNQHDYTAATSLVSLMKGFSKNGKTIQFVNCDEKWIQVLQDAGLSKPPVINYNDIIEFVKKASTNTIILNLPSSEVTVISDAPTTPSILTSNGSKPLL